MTTDKLTPEKSFELINQIISNARNRYIEDGFIYVLWGILIAIASISQFILLKNQHYDINYYPYFLMPIGGLYSWYYYSRKERGKHNQISKSVSYTWIVLSLNLMILGFFFSSALKENLVPVILILLSVGLTVSGILIKERVLLFSGIIINLSAFICFNIKWVYHPLLMGIVSIVTVLVPGILLMNRNKRRNNV